MGKKIDWGKGLPRYEHTYITERDPPVTLRDRFFCQKRRREDLVEKEKFLRTPPQLRTTRMFFRYKAVKKGNQTNDKEGNEC